MTSDMDPVCGPSGHPCARALQAATHTTLLRAKFGVSRRLPSTISSAPHSPAPCHGRIVSSSTALLLSVYCCSRSLVQRAVPHADTGSPSNVAPLY